MRRRMITLGLALGIAVGALLLTPGGAQAHGPKHGRPGNSSYYYGMGEHDFVPHWHKTQTPFGTYRWFGLGQHDFVPHEHRVTPWSYKGYSYTPWGATRSYYPRYPAYYAPW